MNLKKKKYFVLRKTLKKKKLFLNYTREHAHHFFFSFHIGLFIFLNGMGTKIEDVVVLNIATH